jgi:hypothetical protein
MSILADRLKRLARVTSDVRAAPPSSQWLVLFWEEPKREDRGRQRL